MALLAAFAMPVGYSVYIAVASVMRARGGIVQGGCVWGTTFVKSCSDLASEVQFNMPAFPRFLAVTVLSASLFDLVLAIANEPSAIAPVDQLIPWLMDEESQLRGIPFSEVIMDATGKHVLAFDPKAEVDRRVIKRIGDGLNETLQRMNAADSPIQKIKRINEVSSHFEDSLRELLNAGPDLKCDFPRTSNGKVQRAGYPDLRIVDVASNKIFYIDPKLYAAGSRESSFRTFYFEPRVATGKIHDDAVHLIAGIEHQPSPRSGSASQLREGGSASPKATWKFTRWDLVDLSKFKVKLKSEFQGSNRDMYRPEAIVASSEK